MLISGLNNRARYRDLKLQLGHWLPLIGLLRRNFKPTGASGPFATRAPGMARVLTYRSIYTQPSYGDRVWYFLTEDHRLVYWLPPFPPLYLIDLDSIRAEGNRASRIQEIDIRNKGILVPAPSAFKPATSGDGEYDVYKDGKRAVPLEGALFYEVEKGH